MLQLVHYTIVHSIFVVQVSKKLFTYPSPWLVVCKQLTDENGKIRERIREQWRVFAACKTKKGLTFAEDTPVLVQVCQLSILYYITQIINR